MNFFECLSKGYVPPNNYFKSDLFKMLGISYKTWTKLYNSAKKNNDNKEVFLSDELKKIGYTKTQKLITKKQCLIIFEFIGFPDLTGKNKEFLLKERFITKKDLEQADIFVK